MNTRLHQNIHLKKKRKEGNNSKDKRGQQSNNKFKKDEGKETQL